MNAQRLLNQMMIEINEREILDELNVQFPNELRIAILTIQNRKLQEQLNELEQ